MSKKSILSYAMIALFLFSTNLTQAVVKSNIVEKHYSSVFELDAEDLINLEKTDLEKKIGRKLNIKEKLTLSFVKRKLRKNSNLTGENALEQVKTDGMAIAGFVTGLVSLFLFGFILGVLGVIFSAIALKRIKREPESRKGKGLAIAGLILGIVGIIGWTLYLLILLAG